MSKVKDVSTMYGPLVLTEKFVKNVKILFKTTISIHLPSVKMSFHHFSLGIGPDTYPRQ